MTGYRLSGRGDASVTICVVSLNDQSAFGSTTPSTDTVNIRCAVMFADHTLAVVGVRDATVTTSGVVSRRNSPEVTGIARFSTIP